MVRLATAAFPLLPAEGATAVVEAGSDWRFDPDALTGLDAAVWGRLPLPSGSSVGTAARSAAAREMMLRRLVKNPPDGLERVSVHRWQPARFDRLGARAMARAALFQGALVVLRSKNAPDTRLETLARGVEVAVGSYRPGTAGGGLAFGRRRGLDVLLRVARAGDRADPRHAADAMSALAGVDLVPDLHGLGVHADVSWTLESVLQGARPQRLQPQLVDAVARFCLALPHSDGSSMSFDDDLAAIGVVWPQSTSSLERWAARYRPPLAALPSVLRHGDLWAGNLLVDRGRLTGVVDWDHWHPRGVVGADLVHLLALDRAVRTDASFGALYEGLQREGLEVLDRHLESAGISPGVNTTEAVVAAWWAGAVAGTLTRLPHLADDLAWRAGAMDRVLARS